MIIDVNTLILCRLSCLLTNYWKIWSNCAEYVYLKLLIRDKCRNRPWHNRALTQSHEHTGYCVCDYAHVCVCVCGCGYGMWACVCPSSCLVTQPGSSLGLMLPVYICAHVLQYAFDAIRTGCMCECVYSSLCSRSMKEKLHTLPSSGGSLYDGFSYIEMRAMNSRL